MSEKPTLFSTLPVIRHSFATPVTNILLNAQIATENLSRHPRQPSNVYLQRVVLNAQYLQSILTLHDSGAPESFSPTAALNELITLNEGTTLHASLVQRVFLSDKSFLLGSKLAFQETAACLLNNAFESYQDHHTNRLIFLSLNENDIGVVLTIADGGKGMDWLARQLCTTPRYTKKHRHSGTGLHFVKQTVEREFGGRLSLASRPNRGTTVTAVFPNRRDYQPIAKPAPSFQY